jgi:hypothetical protein
MGGKNSNKPQPAAIHLGIMMDYQNKLNFDI